MNIKKIIKFLAYIFAIGATVGYMAKMRKERMEMWKYKKKMWKKKMALGEGGWQKPRDISSSFTAYIAQISPFLSAEDAKSLLDKNPEVIILDVSDQYNDRHIAGAVNAPIGDGTLETEMPNWDKSATYLIYGNDDNETTTAMDMMTSAGFDRVYALDEGLDGWENAGYEVERPSRDQNCCYTVSTSEESEDHTHRWCEGEEYTEDYTDEQGLSHSHMIDEEQNQALPAGQGPHTHQLRKEERRQIKVQG